MSVNASDKPHRIFLGIGGNLAPDGYDGPREGAMAALAALETVAIRITAMSRWFETAPVPISEQPWFMNAVVMASTDLGPADMLRVLHETEAAFGRQRRVRNEARVLDIDLLDYDGLVSDDDALMLPHPRMHQRAFVLHPLRDVAPDWTHPVSGLSVDELIKALPADQKIRPAGD